MYGIIVSGKVVKGKFIGRVKFNALLNKDIDPYTDEISCMATTDIKDIHGKTFYRCGNYWLHVWK